MSKPQVKAHTPRFYAAPCNAEVTRKVFGRRKMLESRWWVRVDATFKGDWNAFDTWFEETKDQRHVEAASLLQKIVDPLRNSAISAPTSLKFAGPKDQVASPSHGWAVWTFPSVKVTLYIGSEAQGVWIETKTIGSRHGNARFFIALEWDKAGVELRRQIVDAAAVDA